MPNMRFSVLVPTRDRAATLRHTLATLTSQPGDDYEIVVADNCSGPAVEEVVRATGFPRMKYTRAAEVLPMAENWERGLSLCEGEYVTVLGDDDAFLPSTLRLAAMLIDESQAEVIGWRPHRYWWPDTIAPWLRNRLFIDFGNGAGIHQSRQALEGFYQGEVTFGMLPSIYNGFFHRRVLDEARRRHGAFFVPAEVSPDVTSGILGLHLTERFVFASRALTLRGNSGRSNGTAHWMRSLGAEQRAVYEREERVGLRGMVHDSLVLSPNLVILIASTKLKCKERYFPGDASLTVDLRGVVTTMLENLNHDPGAYDDNLRDAQALAAKIGMAIEPGAIPHRATGEPPAFWGPTQQGPVKGLSVNCELAGVSDVAAAARLVDALMPPAETFLAGAEPARPGGHHYDAGQTAAAAAPRAMPILGRLLSDLFRRRPLK
jgi:glycosyltransferase involved in cell wall biosynthesis